MGADMTRRMVNTRVNGLSKEHGTVSAMVARTKRGAAETYRLTGRGAVVCKAIAEGRPVPPRPVEWCRPLISGTVSERRCYDEA